MKRRRGVLLLGGLALLCVILLSCEAAPAAETEGETVKGEVVVKEQPKETEAKETPAAAVPEEEKGPQHGGWINVFWTYTTVPGWAPASYASTTASTYPVYEPLAIEDWARGPSGTGEIPMDSTYTPIYDHRPHLAVSWEQTDLQTIIFHIRQGVRFQDKPPVNGREMTADDVVFSWYQCQSEPRGSWYKPPDTPDEKLYHATALDEWTVEFKLPSPDVFVISRLAGDVTIMPHEIYDEYGDYEDWRNACGTGPFIAHEVVTGSSISYVRNPNYWMTDPLHPDNKLPYVDGIRFQLIPDLATRLAAMRTGKIDRIHLGWEDAKTLWETDPDLPKRRLFPTSSTINYTRTDIEPFNDMRIRQAINLATNHEEIARDLYGGEAAILTWPLMPSAGVAYTPLEELPTEPLIPGSTVSCAELFTYNPEKAKALLAEAGYPNGFTLQVCCTSSNADFVSLLKSYWDAVGMEVEVTIIESGAWASYTMAHEFPMIALGGWGNAVPLYAFEYAYRCGHPWSSSVVCDSHIDDTWDAIKMTLDEDTRNQMWHDLNLYAMEQAYYVSYPRAYEYIFWQPWLKGYSGELETGRLWNYYGFARFAWIDEALRESLR